MTDDPRNVAGGRKGRIEYDTTLVFNPDVVDKYSMHLVANGVLVTKCFISPADIYFADRMIDGEKELVYHKILCPERIIGFTGGDPHIQRNVALDSSGHRTAGAQQKGAKFGKLADITEKEAKC